LSSPQLHQSGFFPAFRQHAWSQIRHVVSPDTPRQSPPRQYAPRLQQHAPNRTNTCSSSIGSDGIVLLLAVVLRVSKCSRRLLDLRSAAALAVVCACCLWLASKQAFLLFLRKRRNSPNAFLLVQLYVEEVSVSLFLKARWPSVRPATGAQLLGEAGALDHRRLSSRRSSWARLSSRRRGTERCSDSLSLQSLTRVRTHAEVVC